MRRLWLATTLLGLLFSGCPAMVESGSAEPGAIAPTQFLRPMRDSQTGTWVAAWVDPTNSQFGSGIASE